MPKEGPSSPPSAPQTQTTPLVPSAGWNMPSMSPLEVLRVRWALSLPKGKLCTPMSSSFVLLSTVVHQALSYDVIHEMQSIAYIGAALQCNVT